MLVLNREECLEPILEEMLEKGIGGATILESTGMMRVLNDDQNVDLPMLIRHFYNPERKTSKTMIALIRDEQLPVLMKIINVKTGGLNKPNTGIAFAVPTTFVEGLDTNK